jgi:hypothetical protein
VLETHIHNDYVTGGLAQRYYIQSLWLAKAGGARALGAHVLADMSIQAYDLGQARVALAWPKPATARHATAAHRQPRPGAACSRPARTASPGTLLRPPAR